MRIEFWHEWKYWLIGIGIHNYSFHKYEYSFSIYFLPFRIMFSFVRRKNVNV